MILLAVALTSPGWQLEVFVNQNKQLLEELSSSNQRLQTAEAQAEDLENELRRMKAAEGLVKRYGIEECEALEAELKASLGRVEKRKVSIIFACASLC